jgi:class 3 adenylate cyclase
MARSHSYTRELVLESLDQHAILLYEVARKLNLVSNMKDAIATIIDIYTNAMGVNVCKVILNTEFNELAGSEYNHELVKGAILNRSAEVISVEMYVPVITGDDVLALIYMKKLSPGTRHFDRRDLMLAIAISYQFSLILQRLQAIEAMHEEESIKNLLMRFFAPLDAESFIKTYKKRGELPRLKEQKVTVMFSDIADSTGLAETLGAVQFAAILGAYYENATEIIFRHSGIVKYLGDGILAIFPERGTQDTEKEAVLAARELVSQFEHTGSLEAGRRTVIGVSINTGKAMMGYVGTKERAEFNVLGDVVNVAFRLQKYARPNKIIVSSSTIAAVSTDFEFRRVGAVSLRGRAQDVQAFEVFPRTNPMSSVK